MKVFVFHKETRRAQTIRLQNLQECALEYLTMEFQNKDGLDKLTSGTIKISKHTLNKVYQMLLLNKRIIFQETKKKLIYKIFSN